MSYCVHCGVKLADYETACPLCHTPVIDPNHYQLPLGTEAIKSADFPPYPSYQPITLQKVSKKSVLELITLLFMIPFSLVLLCDISITSSITWSAFAMFSIALLYLFFVAPFIPKRANAIVSVALDGVGLLGFLSYIELVTNGKWFYSFALPLILWCTIVIIVIIALTKYTAVKRLNIVSIALFLIGISCLWIELLINFAFHARHDMIWSEYPFAVFAFLGVILLFIRRNKPLYEKLKRRFFL